MASLAEQVKELLSILDVVNPAAAAEIRGHRPPMKQPPQPPPQPERKTAERARRPEKIVADPPLTVGIDRESAMQPDLLNINLSSDSLVQGIIYSEILAKPRALRRRRGWR